MLREGETQGRLCEAVYQITASTVLAAPTGRSPNSITCPDCQILIIIATKIFTT